MLVTDKVVLMLDPDGCNTTCSVVVFHVVVYDDDFVVVVIGI